MSKRERESLFIVPLGTEVIEVSLRFEFLSVKYTHRMSCYILQTGVFFTSILIDYMVSNNFEWREKCV